MLNKRIAKYAITLAAGVSLIGQTLTAEGFPLGLKNEKSGISLELDGTNGKDWAVERTFHNGVIGDQVLYLRAATPIALVHNERNAITKVTKVIPQVIGAHGADGVPDSGDEGVIHYKIDRDLQALPYSSLTKPLPATAPAYTTPFSFANLTYDGELKVLGTTGDNGGAWGRSACYTFDRFAYGQADSFGNEWHSLTYWDDDVPLFNKAGEPPHRQGASDGNWLPVCVNPVTPVIQLGVPEDGSLAQFYTTPIKTYHIPKIYAQTSYVTDDVLINFVNLTNGEPVQYRVGTEPGKNWNGQAIRAKDLIPEENTPTVLSVRNGTDGPILTRTFVRNPAFPAPEEDHGTLLWADAAGLAEMQRKTANVEPFKTAWREFSKSEYYQKPNTEFTSTRDTWCATTRDAGTTLNNAFIYAVEPDEANVHFAALAKQRLLHMFRLEAVGFEVSVADTTPAKDYFNELGQTMQFFADAAIAYDLLAANFRNTDHPDGLTPIEEIYLRDSLGELAKTLLQFRSNYMGGGDAHWAHGYEMVLGITALAMPTYQSEYYGVSGGDFITKNNTADANGEFWNPFPNQGVTWYEAATDPNIETPGHPNVNFPFRAEFLMSDDGYWVGPNYLQGDGNRYYQGAKRMLVDVRYGGMANADARVELLEMEGYESPFVTRHYAWEYIRRLKGDTNIALPSENYNRRRLVNGVILLKWDAATKTYQAQEPRFETALYAFNPVFAYAGLPSAKNAATEVLEAAKSDTLIRRLMYDPYMLAMASDPETIPSIPANSLTPKHPPFIKSMYKQVVAPGELIKKLIIAGDMDDNPVQVTVRGLPAGATFDASTRMIRWTPTQEDVGVHVIEVFANDGTTTQVQPFPVIVMTEAHRRKSAVPPTNVTVAQSDDGDAVNLSWDAPAADDIVAYVVYKDGYLIATTKAGETAWTDRNWIRPNNITRYRVSAVSETGGESDAIATTPDILITQ